MCYNSLSLFFMEKIRTKFNNTKNWLAQHNYTITRNVLIFICIVGLVGYLSEITTLKIAGILDEPPMRLTTIVQFCLLYFSMSGMEAVLRNKRDVFYRIKGVMMPSFLFIVSATIFSANLRFLQGKGVGLETLFVGTFGVDPSQNTELSFLFLSVCILSSFLGVSYTKHLRFLLAVPFLLASTSFILYLTDLQQVFAPLPSAYGMSFLTSIGMLSATITISYLCCKIDSIKYV